MPAPLRLALTDYLDPTRWRWVLSDGRDQFLGDHTVRLDPATREYRGFLDLRSYLEYHEPIHTPAEQLDRLGSWIGEAVFGKLREILWARRANPALTVHMVAPQDAQDVLLRPYELARFADGKGFRAAGVRFVYGLEGAPRDVAKEPTERALRILSVFSLPLRANPLNLRRERYGLQRLVRELNQTQGVSAELRVLQYGATRDTLREALEEAESWDVIHLSGHGQKGELLLEDDRGGEDTINVGDLGDLLDLARSRLKLLILDACYSGAGGHAGARRQIGLDPPERQEGAAGGSSAEKTAQTELPGLAQELSHRLDCATLAMRYPVGDDFATDLMLELYEKLLAKGRPLPAALNLALADVLKADTPKPSLSAATPILVGVRAAELQLAPPKRGPHAISLPTHGLSIAFPPEPEHFVGRLQPMLRASQALAPHSAKRGVIFYGMPGAGKTACALELAYRHDQGRFRAPIWHRAPEADTDISTALFNLMQDVQTQLNAPDLGLTTALDDPRAFRQFTLPRLRALLKTESLLLVLDNLESLLTVSNGWRDPLWGEVVTALLEHDGPSRVVITSRRVPAGLAAHPKVQPEAIHALSFAESVLLARELRNLRRLFDDESGRELLQKTLRVIQGHPKLVELADALASDRSALAARVAAASDGASDRADVLDAFFATGVTREGETRRNDAAFVQVLHDWTAGVLNGVSSTARLLLAFLCQVEPEDRQRRILDANWKDFLTRLGADHAAASAALAEPEAGLPTALAALDSAGLVKVERPVLGPDETEALMVSLAAESDAGDPLDPALRPEMLEQIMSAATSYTIHPSIAETIRAAAEPDLIAAADRELGAYYVSATLHWHEQEMQGGSSALVESARRGTPYLLRQGLWGKASTLLEQILLRDKSPATLSFALPLLRRVTEATDGTEEELADTGVLAKALIAAGRALEAEPVLRSVLARAVERGSYRIASGISGELVNLLKVSGRLEEALSVAEDEAHYKALAGLGPWTQISVSLRHLQILIGLGRYDEVLAEVGKLKSKMDGLPEQSEHDESVRPWSVREVLLDIGGSAALFSDRWEMALAINSEIVELVKARGADRIDVASRRFNDYGPLLRLHRYDEARELLQDCRAEFEQARAVGLLGTVYSALAHLEFETDGIAEAVRFEAVALSYKYQGGLPESCSISHNNLCGYLMRLGSDPVKALAHGLAAVTIWLQTRSGRLSGTVQSLARLELPSIPPPFADVIDVVETIPGVRFRELFERMPHTVPDGDAALATIWRLVAEEKQRQFEASQTQDAVLDSAPPAVRAAFELEGEAFSTALQTALAELPQEEAANLLRRLRESGLIANTAESGVARVLDQFEPLLQAIAAASKDESQREQIDSTLVQMEANGWHLTDPVRRIWAGERDTEALTAGLDEQDAALVRRVLELLNP